MYPGEGMMRMSFYPYGFPSPSSYPCLTTGKYYKSPSWETFYKIPHQYSPNFSMSSENKESLGNCHTLEEGKKIGQVNGMWLLTGISRQKKDNREERVISW